MQLRDISAVILILVVWSAASSPNTSRGPEKYDPNSIEQTQRILRLLLRLAYHTANRLIRLKNAARLRTEHIVDKDLQNITMKEIMLGITMNQKTTTQPITSQPSTEPSVPDIQSRFFSDLQPNALFRSLDPSTSMKPLESPGPANLGELSNVGNISILASGPVGTNLDNKTVNAVISSIGQATDPGASSIPGDLQGTGTKIMPAEAASNQTSLPEVEPSVNHFSPLFRFLPDFEESNVTTTTGMTREEGIGQNLENLTENLTTTTAGSNIFDGHGSIKRETSPVPVSVSTHVKNQTIYSVGNFSTSNVTDGEQDHGSTRNYTNVEAVVPKPEPQVPRSGMGKENKGGHLVPCEHQDIGDIFDYTYDENEDEENNYDGDLEKLISQMKLQQVANQLIDALQPLAKDDFR